MYTKFQLGLKYLNYYLSASNGKGYGIHSPFVFHFITKVLNDKSHYPEYDAVESLRQKLLKDRTILNVEDFGAGSSVSKSNQRTVASIARNVVKPKKYGQLLFRMVREYQPKNIVELGTSLGITASYLSLANKDGWVTTIEGSEKIAAIAKENFATLKLHGTELINDNFDNILSSVIHKLSSIDLAFIDGNHRRQPTMQYFETILSKTHNLSIVVLDDIHWSTEMEQAWKYCKGQASVTLSIDLFFIGILFFKKEIKEKQHFTIRF